MPACSEDWTIPALEQTIVIHSRYPLLVSAKCSGLRVGGVSNGPGDRGEEWYNTCGLREGRKIARVANLIERDRSGPWS
jgi:hypothetical protein